MLKRIAVVLMALLLLLLPSGITEEEYRAVNRTVRAIEPCVDVMLVYNVQYEVDGNLYQFDKKIPSSTRMAFIRTQEALLTLIENRTGQQIEGCAFRVQKQYACRSDGTQGHLYAGIDAMGTWQHAAATMELVYGDCTNYGYLYALADLACTELGWTRDAASTANESLFASEPALLNLVYPCFTKQVTAADEISACKALSIELLADMDNPFSGEAAFLAARDAYAAEHVPDFTPTYLRFGYNGETCPIRGETAYVNLEISADFREDAGVWLGLRDACWTASVEDMILAMEEMDQQLAAMCQAFSHTLDEKASLIMTDSLHQPSVTVDLLAYVLDHTTTIRAMSIDVVGHEYIHCMYAGLADLQSELWMNEALAYYYAMEISYDMFRAGGWSNSTLFMQLTDQIPALELYPLMYDAMLHIDKEDPTEILYGTVVTEDVLSIASYIVRNYGEEAFRECMLHPARCEELTGRTMDVLVAEWADYIVNDVEADVPDYMEGTFYN